MYIYIKHPPITMTERCTGRGIYERAAGGNWKNLEIGLGGFEYTARPELDTINKWMGEATY